MSINAERAADKVVRKLRSIGIDEHVGRGESHTAILVRIIVEAVLDEVVNNGEVIIKNLPVQTPQGPGTGNGKADII